MSYRSTQTLPFTEGQCGTLSKRWCLRFVWLVIFLWSTLSCRLAATRSLCLASLFARRTFALFPLFGLLHPATVNIGPVLAIGLGRDAIGLSKVCSDISRRDLLRMTGTEGHERRLSPAGWGIALVLASCSSLLRSFSGHHREDVINTSPDHRDFRMLFRVQCAQLLSPARAAVAAAKTRGKELPKAADLSEILCLFIAIWTAVRMCSSAFSHAANSPGCVVLVLLVRLLSGRVFFLWEPGCPTSCMYAG